ncbi:hypothetical protein RFI_08241 [Reticulomyxa filosa]|uniref:Tudor-knot domain-containing protein n=1 Tax=Reticulomyxa filosa TaxID=46433 RepID=X6NSD9_RETFI|nr:hypothetical protein RFI_08241 [Reticulomyxa filosa]|eukprot:ETO28886.1 hypothetical protein RFI_08241 [Reticulomyxa filosa]
MSRSRKTKRSLPGLSLPDYTTYTYEVKEKLLAKARGVWYEAVVLDRKAIIKKQIEWPVAFSCDMHDLSQFNVEKEKEEKKEKEKIKEKETIEETYLVHYCNWAKRYDEWNNR